ncbi:phosphatase PAP2 family protein [Phytoactinopolyspora halotolerans]|uniref:Phosphatase PAP2 family protein n=2 Tax=Phytoactinopolyspora halotolerans TaxID=1981512 RepID=A0A6L9S3U9_9ACTN|nr:phosphatase PAP2 family protein [Phytoactinopolyspora halotolerans]
MCAAGVVGTWLTWRYFVGTSVGQRIDDTAFRGSEIGHTTLWRVAEPVLEIVSIPFIVVVLGAAAVIALIRRRWLLALQVTILVGGANITTQFLKYVVLDRPDLADTAGAIDNSLPSGHTTVAASVAAALLLVVPRHTRPTVAVLAAGYTAATGVATMVGGWHRPSDVVAALTVVMAWAGLTMFVTALGSPETVRPPDSAIVPTTVVGGLMLVAGFISGLLSASALQSTSDALTRTDTVTNRSDLLEAYTGSALGVVATTAAVFATILITHQFACRPAGPLPATSKSKDRVQTL